MGYYHVKVLINRPFIDTIGIKKGSIQYIKNDLVAFHVQLKKDKKHISTFLFVKYTQAQK